MKRALITGHMGFIGRHLHNRLVHMKWDVHGLDAKNGEREDITICDLARRDRDYDRVFHLAAQTDAYCKDYRWDAEVNIAGTLRVLEAFDPAKVVVASTAMVNYPHTYYAISKATAEGYARVFGAAVVRLPNIYGPGGHSVIDKFREQEECTIFGDGEQLRTYAEVTVAVSALVLARPGTVTVVNGDNKTVNEIARETGKPVRYLPARDLDMQVAVQKILSEN